MGSECREGSGSVQEREQLGPVQDRAHPGLPSPLGSWQPCQAHIPDTLKSSPETSEGDQKTSKWGTVPTVTRGQWACQALF